MREEGVREGNLGYLGLMKEECVRERNLGYLVR